MTLAKTIFDYIMKKEKTGYVVDFMEDGQPKNIKYDFLSDCSDMDDVVFNIKREIINYQDDTGIVISESIGYIDLVDDILELLKVELDLPHVLNEVELLCHPDSYYDF